MAAISAEDTSATLAEAISAVTISDTSAAGTSVISADVTLAISAAGISAITSPVAIFAATILRKAIMDTDSVAGISPEIANSPRMDARWPQPDA